MSRHDANPMAVAARRAVLALVSAGLFGCADVPASTRQDHGAAGAGSAGMTASAATAPDGVVRAALQDAARVSGLAPAQLKVADAEAVTWSDGSIGCPQPGRLYTQALVPGWRVRIQAGPTLLVYHASERGAPFLCPQGRALPPLPGRSGTI